MQLTSEPRFYLFNHCSSQSLPITDVFSCKMSRKQPCRKLPRWCKITQSCSKSSSLYFGGNPDIYQHRLAGLPSSVSTFSSLLPTSSTSALLSRIRRNQFKMAILVNIWKSCEIQVWGKLLQAAGKSPHRFSPPTRASYSGGSPWCHQQHSSFLDLDLHLVDHFSWQLSYRSLFSTFLRTARVPSGTSLKGSKIFVSDSIN